MILAAPFFDSKVSLPLYSDYLAELSESTSNTSVSSGSSPALSLTALRIESPKQPTVQQRKERRVFDLPCAICSNEATGYHYNVASCNGCKTFFRRCVLGNSVFKCVRSDSKCLLNLQDGARIKCRSCRLDRCLEQGMRREAVTSGILGNNGRRQDAAAMYVAHLSQPSTSNGQPRVIETASRLRQTFHLINKFRRCNVSPKDIDHHINKLLSMPSYLENQERYEDVRDSPNFKRDLPAWLTMDLMCSVEFAKKIPDLEQFCDRDKEELIRGSCLTLAVAIQAIESYFDNHRRVVMPDGTDVIQTMIDSKNNDARYQNMFVTILDPLHREQFTIDELVLALQLLFFTTADPTNLTENGKEQLKISRISSMQLLMAHVALQDQKKFPSRYGLLTALNESFLKASLLSKQKMKEGDQNRIKLEDKLIEECCFEYRPPIDDCPYFKNRNLSI